METARPTYQEFAPPQRLREHVVCIWYRAGNADARAAERLVLPDGCIDIIWMDDQSPFIAGPMIRPTCSKAARNATVLGIRFQPAVAPALLGVSASELLQENVALRDVWPNHRYLPWADIALGNDIATMLVGIEVVLTDRLAALDQSDLFVRAAAQWIASHPHEDLSGLSHLSNLSERQMRRRFDEAIGYGPKKLQRILRMQRLLWLTGRGQGKDLNLSRLAFAAGYADQPHMTREVTALTGISPKHLFSHGTRSAVSDLFKTASR